MFVFKIINIHFFQPSITVQLYQCRHRGLAYSLLFLCISYNLLLHVAFLSHYCRCCCNPGKCSGSKQNFFCSSPTPLLLSLLEAIPARHKHASKHSTSLWPRYLFVQLRRHRPISHFGSRSSPNVAASSNIFLDLHDGGFVNIVQSIGLSVSD